MKTMQKGFTLIELMIVVAIIGILAAVAVPAYQDYTVKAKVSEAASLAGAVKTAMEVAYSEGYSLGSIPTTPSQLGLPKATSYQSKYVSQVAYSASGVVSVSLENEPSLPTNVKGKVITYTPTDHGGNLEWIVSSTIPQKYWPKK